MAEFNEKFLLPIATGTIIGFILTWVLEIIRIKYRRNKILAALLTYLDALPRFNEYNQTATRQPAPDHIVPMLYPTVPFETAIFSEDGISVRKETLQATTEYLIKAMELNALIRILQDNHFAREDEIADTRFRIHKFLYDQAEPTYMPQLITELKMQIEREQNFIIRFWRYLKIHKK